METRLATEDDLDQVRFIINQCRDWLGYVRWPALREAIARRELIVVVKGGTVVGFCHFRALAGKGMATICEMGVREEYRRMGVGRMLLGYFVQRLRLKSIKDNHAASEFYANMGFEVVGEEHGNLRPLLVWERHA